MRRMRRIHNSWGLGAFTCRHKRTTAGHFINQKGPEEEEVGVGGGGGGGEGGGGGGGPKFLSFFLLPRCHQLYKLIH